MRIDLNNSIARQVAAEKSAKAKENSSASTSAREDKATFSQSSLSLPGLVKSAMSPSAARQERVAALRDVVQSDQYKPDPAAMAKAMLEESGQ
jgi:anti-sigma28 factor (negative regulator of flagellin synthesis)